MKKKKDSTKIEVTINNEVINKSKASETFVDAINIISNIVGKDVLSNDFPTVISRTEFIKNDGFRYSQSIDESGTYFIHHHTSTVYKRDIISKMLEKYEIYGSVSIIEGNANTIEVEDTPYPFIDDLDMLYEIVNTSLDIEKYLNCNDILCKKLSETDNNVLRTYYNSDKNGVVVDIRKEIAKEILLNGIINSESLTSIIERHRSKEPQKLKSWVNPYRILHPFVNHAYRHIDEFINELGNRVIDKIGGIKYNIANFNGAQHQGSESYYITFFNEKHNSQSDGIQLYIYFKNGGIEYGVYRHIDETYLDGPHLFNGNLNELNSFIKKSSTKIKEDCIKSKDIIRDVIRDIFVNSGNHPLSLIDVKSKLSSRVKKTVILEVLSDKKTFDRVVTNETKYKLVSYFSPKLKEHFIKDGGFLTIDMLVEILSKNNISINI